MTSQDDYFRALVRFHVACEAGIDVSTLPDYAVLRKTIDSYTESITNVIVMIDPSGGLRQKDLSLYIN